MAGLTGSGPRVRTEVAVPVEVGPGQFVDATMFSFTGLRETAEHLAVAFRQPLTQAAPLVRIHSECLTGDVFGSRRCDCGAQLRESLRRMAQSGGVVIYMRQEGRGIGLYKKLEAYRLQDGGDDTFDANRRLNLPDDGRSYAAAAEILLALGLRHIRLISNNPDKLRQLERAGITVHERISTGVFVTPDNIGYLRAKAARAGHFIYLPEPQTT